MDSERATRLLATASWAIPLPFLALHMVMLSRDTHVENLAVGLSLVATAMCALVVAVICGFVALNRSRRLHGGKYFWQAALGLCVSSFLLARYVMFLTWANLI